MQPTRAGLLRHRIVIQAEPATTPNNLGERVVGPIWTPFLTVWASIAPVSGREMEYAKSFAATVSHRVIIRYQPGILDSMRVIYEGRTFAINAVLNTEERDRMITLYCTEQTE